MELLSFVGRKTELDLIKQKADNLFTNQQNQFLFISGLQGMGKTRLLKEVISRLDNDQHFITAYLDMRELKNLQVEEALEKLSLKLKKQLDIPFIFFSFVYYVYLRKMHPSYEPNIFENSIKEKNGTFRNILSLCSKIPVVGEVFKLGDLVLDIVDLIGTTFKVYSEVLAKSIETDLRNLDTLEALEIAELLPKYFAKDLNKFIDENGIKPVFLLDVYESILEKDITREAISDKEKWLFDSKKGLFNYLNSSLFVLTGRDEILWMKKVPYLKDSYSSIKLDKLEPKEVKILLGSIPEVEIRERFETLTKGHPYSIDLAIDLYYQKENLSSVEKVTYFSKMDSSELLQDYFIENMLEREKTLLTLFSLCNFWNEEMFLYLNDKFKLGYSILDFQKIINHSYIETSDNEYFTLHSLMTESFQKRCDQKTADSLHKAMFEYYQKKLVGISSQTILPLHEEAFIEAFFHGIEILRIDYFCENFYNWFFNNAIIFDKAGKWNILLLPYKTATSAFTEKLGEENQYSIGAISNLAYYLNNMGKYKESLPLSEKAYKLRLKINGEEDIETLRTLNNLVILRVNMGMYKETFELAQKSYHLHQKVLGESNIDTMKSMNSLAGLLNKSGKDDQALILLEQLYEVSRKVLGEEHPDTIGVINNLAVVFTSLGQDAKAQPYYELSYTLSKKRFGEDHPDTISSLDNLAIGYFSLNDNTTALKLFEKCLENNIRVLGEEHPYTLDCYNNLACCLIKLGHHDKALPFSEKAFFLRQKTLGEENLDTLLSANNYAYVLRVMGKTNDALLLYEKVYSLRKRDLEKNHPYTLFSLKVLADFYTLLGRTNDAEKLYKTWEES